MLPIALVSHREKNLFIRLPIKIPSFTMPKILKIHPSPFTSPTRFLHSNVPIATDYNFSSSNCSNSVELTQFHERFDKFLLGA